jgi:hypothetical protein
MSNPIKEGIPLDDQVNKILACIRQVDNSVRDSKLRRVDSQIREGTIYFYRFEGDRVVEVQSRPWLGSRIDIKKSNGERVELNTA